MEGVAMRYKLSEIIGVQPGFKAAVDILQDLENEDKIRGYIPTENGVKVIEQIFDYLKPYTSTRPIILTGTYGTGKSHLGLVIATLLRKGIEDKLFKSLFAKIEPKWSAIGEKIKRAKESYGEKSYMLVYLEAEKVDWGSGFFNNSLILALKEALKREELENITPKTAYDRALDRIQEIKRDFPDAYTALEREIANEGYYSVRDMEHKLRKHERQCLEDFADIHKKVSAGAYFDWYSGVSASDAYSTTIEALKEEGFKGILLIWDEFTPVLRKLIEDPLSGEALAFQKFAQTCETAGVDKIISIFISIRDIQEMIDRVVIESLRGESLRKDAEKISGRFRVMRLGHIDREAYYLMKGVISHKEAFDGIMRIHNGQFFNVRNEVDELNLFHEYGLSSDDKKIIVEDLYPLHPLTTLALSRLTDRVGQRERTIFTFLCDTGEGTFCDFLEKKEITETYLSFIYPFELKSYFLPLIRQSQDYKELRRLSRKYEETIAFLSPNDEVGRKVIETIFLLSASNIPSTTEHIHFSLGCVTLSDKISITTKLEELKSSKRITQRISDKTYRFFGQSLDVAMDDHVKEVISEISTRYSLKELFNDAIMKIGIKGIYRSVEAENYNIDRSIERKINLEFILARELDNPESLRKKVEEKYCDGAYYFVLADTEDGLSMAKRKIQQYFSEDTNILFALPLNVSHFQEITPSLRKLEALEELPEKYPQYESELREELISEEDDTKQFLKSKIDELLDPSRGYVEFYYKGEKRGITAINRLRELVSEMMENTFPYTPSVAREELIKEEGSDTWRTRYRIPLIDTVLSPRAEFLLIQETDAVKRSIIEVIYKRHGILRQEGGNWVLEKPKSSPDNNAMAKIWEEIENFIKVSHAFNDFSELIKELKSLPYGLKQRTIGLILAPVLRKYVLQDNLILEWKGQPIEKIDGSLIEERIVLREQQIKVRYQAITDKNKEMVSAVADVFGSNEKDIESVYRAVVNWWRGLPAHSRNTNKISEHAKKLKSSFFEPLSTQEENKRVLFYRILPDLIGIEDISRKTDQEVERITKERMSQIKEEFEVRQSKLHDEIKSAVTGVFGSEKQLLSYYSNLPEDTQKQIFAGDAKKLIDWLNKVSSKGNLLLEDFVDIAEEILGKSDDWNDEQVSVLKGHLESAKNQIESYTPTPLPPQPPPTRKDKDKPLLNNKKKKLTIGNIEGVFTLYENLEEAPNKEQAQILLNILKGGLLPPVKTGKITGDEFLSIIYHLIKEVKSA